MNNKLREEKVFTVNYNYLPDIMKTREFEKEANNLGKIKIIPNSKITYNYFYDDNDEKKSKWIEFKVTPKDSNIERSYYICKEKNVRRWVPLRNIDHGKHGEYFEFNRSRSDPAPPPNYTGFDFITYYDRDGGNVIFEEFMREDGIPILYRENKPLLNFDKWLKDYYVKRVKTLEYNKNAYKPTKHLKWGFEREINIEEEAKANPSLGTKLKNAYKNLSDNISKNLTEMKNELTKPSAPKPSTPRPRISDEEKPSIGAGTSGINGVFEIFTEPKLRRKISKSRTSIKRSKKRLTKSKRKPKKSKRKSKF
jgi:hypothetical protein